MERLAGDELERAGPRLPRAQWRGELHPDTDQLLTPWPPGTADRLWLTLTRIAASAAH
jgi:hypothetical protein